MIVDADGHFTPVLPLGNHGIDAWIVDYHQRKQGHFSSVEKRIPELEMLKINRQVLNPMGRSLGLDYSLCRHTAPAVMQVYNDTMLDLAQQHQQFDINLWLALQNLPASLEEIDRNLDSEFFAVYVSDIPPYGFLPDLDPVWQRLHRHGIPWYMHLTETNDFIGEPASQWRDLYHGLLAGLQQRHWLVNMASIIAGGVIDRYPNVKIVLAERDINWIDDLVETFDQLGLDDPMPVLRTNFWFTTEPETPGFMANATRLGWDRLLFATDWPHDHDIGGRNSRQDVDTVNSLALTQHQRERVFSANFFDLKNRSPH